MRSSLVISTSLLALILTSCSGSDSDLPSADADSRPYATPGEPDAGSGPGALMAEYQQIQQRLAQVQERAMTDDSLRAAYTSLQDRVEGHMLAADPELREKQSRLQSLGQDLMNARQTGDEEAARTITAEGNALQTGLQQLQADALSDEAIAAELAGFQEKVQTRMAEIDPETPDMIARVEEIGTLLRAGAAPGEAAGADTTGADITGQGASGEEASGE